MPQLPHLVRKERARRLREAVASERARWLDTLVGTTQRIVIEHDGRSGHAESFAPMTLTASAAEGSLVEARVSGIEQGRLVGGFPDAL
jgi:threonylcarbamoyladenosine tRNA methylthiotransferase MtaB